NLRGPEIHKEKIKKHINNYYNNFAQNTTKIIDSILNRHIDPIIFHNVKTEDRVITKPKQINKKIQNTEQNQISSTKANDQN
ncbi:1876_t:CDS:2, partial [Gigaspora margarita]